MSSAMRFDAPMRLSGSAALSVESRMNCSQPWLRCGFDEDLGAERVVGDDGEGVRLHERDVLEGSGVEDDLRAVALEEFGDGGGVGDAAQNGCVRGGAGDLSSDWLTSWRAPSEESKSTSSSACD